MAWQTFDDDEKHSSAAGALLSYAPEVRCFVSTGSQQ